MIIVIIDIDDRGYVGQQLQQNFALLKINEQTCREEREKQKQKDKEKGTGERDKNH